MRDTLYKSTFQLQREIYEDNTEEDTVEIPSFATEYSNFVCMAMMFKLPTLKEGCVEAEAALFSIKQMNEMLKTLTNKLPCRVDPWRMNNLAYGTPKDKDLTELPTDIDFAESYVYYFNRFIQPGKMVTCDYISVTLLLHQPQKSSLFALFSYSKSPLV